jgi:cytochrome c biogenesis factor
MVAWLLLTVGLLAGMWWAYTDPARRGWTWDPVQGSAVVTWLAVTVLAHTLAIRERRGVLRAWNVTLAVVAFLAAVLATYVARDGVLNTALAARAFAVDGWLLLFVCAAAVVSGWLAMIRLGNAPREEPVTGLRSRPARAGALIAYLGAALVVASFAGRARQSHHQVTFGAGEAFGVRDPWGQEWVFTNQGTSFDEHLNRELTLVALRAVRDGDAQPLVRSEVRQHFRGGAPPARTNTYEPVTVPGILSFARQDVYVVFDATLPGRKARVLISFFPLMQWCWWGGALLIAGGLLTLWPRGPVRA